MGVGVAGQTNRRWINLFLAVFLVVLAIDVFIPSSESDESLKDKVNTALVVTGLWQGPWRLYTPADRVNLRFKAEVVFADQTTATWTSPDWSQVSALRKFVLARHMNYFGYVLRADEPAFKALCAYLAHTVPHPHGKVVPVERVKLLVRGALIPPPPGEKNELVEHAERAAAPSMRTGMPAGTKGETMVPAGPYLTFDDWQMIQEWRPPS
jgi:hypothetical protein